jgi:hypothetical protein
MCTANVGQPALTSTSVCSFVLCALQILPQPGSNAAAAGVAAQQDNQDYVVAEFREPTGKRRFKLPGATGAAAAASGHHHAIDAESAPADSAAIATNATEQGGRRKLQQGTIVQDVLIVYTQAAANKAGGEAAIKAAARDTVARTNKAYLDTGLNLRQNLLDARLVSHLQIERRYNSLWKRYDTVSRGTCKRPMAYSANHTQCA